MYMRDIAINTRAVCVCRDVSTSCWKILCISREFVSKVAGFWKTLEIGCEFSGVRRRLYEYQNSIKFCSVSLEKEECAKF